MKYAVIDIGSNSVRLMLWADGKSLYKKVSTTRLGEGIARSACLNEAAMRRTLDAVSAFVREGREAGAQPLLFATAAVRSAANAGEFCARVARSCGAEVDVIPGREEALLALCGALGAAADGGVVDIGGASTELCLRRGGEICFSVSLDVGAVRLFDLCGQDAARLSEEIAHAIAPLCGVKPQDTVYAVGGTASTLACILLGLPAYDAARVQDFKMPQGEVRMLADKLLALSPEERRRVRGMDPARADIIAGGALLLAEIMRLCGMGAVYASDRDNLEGYLSLRGLI